MDFSVIDQLYDIYINENSQDAENQFINYYKKFEQNGKHDFIETLQCYIKEQTQNISSYYISNKDEKKKVKKVVKETTSAFETLLPAIQTFILSKIYDDKDLENIKYETTIKHKELVPNDMFSININLMEEAIKENVPCFLNTFKDVKAIIEYVKKHKLLEKIYSDGSWREMNFSELIESLYDKAKDKTLFEVSYDGIFDYEETLFDKVKENCSKISSIAFDKYRSTLISNRRITLDYGKLIFCKNLLIFYKTGIMPTSDGLIDCSIDFYETLNMIDDFKRLYSKKFDETTFRHEQSNFICNPEIITTDYELEASKKVNFGNRIIIGHIVTGKSSLLGSTNYKIPYLIHINIEDVNNPCSNYEIQLNLLPQGDISNRLQLIRFDNWAFEQPHKNVGKKLQTTTHIHLYNQFDLLRGRVNGNFDIVYNFNNNSTEFDTAFLTFLDILDFNFDLRTELYNKTMKAINQLKMISKSADI